MALETSVEKTSLGIPAPSCYSRLVGFQLIGKLDASRYEVAATFTQFFTKDAADASKTDPDVNPFRTFNINMVLDSQEAEVSDAMYGMFQLLYSKAKDYAVFEGALDV